MSKCISAPYYCLILKSRCHNCRHQNHSVHLWLCRRRMRARATVPTSDLGAQWWYNWATAITTYTCMYNVYIHTASHKTPKKYLQITKTNYDHFKQFSAYITGSLAYVEFPHYFISTYLILQYFVASVISHHRCHCSVCKYNVQLSKDLNLKNCISWCNIMSTREYNRAPVWAPAVRKAHFESH